MYRPKPEHVWHDNPNADIVGFRQRIKCPLIVQIAAVLWIAYAAIMLIDVVLRIIILSQIGAEPIVIIRATFLPALVALVVIYISITIIRGEARGTRGYGWFSIIWGWAQMFFLLVYLGRDDEQPASALSYAACLISAPLIIAGVLALAGSAKYLNWRKKRGLTTT